jgi:hypothetical protein
VSNRDYDAYLSLREHDDPGMFIGRLAKGRVTDYLNLFFARRVSRRPDGKFLELVHPMPPASPPRSGSRESVIAVKG